MIRSVHHSDAKAISEIYNFYVKNTVITFEEEAVSENEMRNRIDNVTKRFPWLVYELNGELLGYSYATDWKTRSAYRHTVESTVYLRNGESGKGIGKKLYQHLISELQKLNIHAVIGGISLPNEASIALHEKLGYKKIGQFHEVGLKFNKWVDVGYWELIL